MSDAWTPIGGETPIDPSGLKDKSIKTRGQLILIEAENIRKATLKYLGTKPTRRSAPFTDDWIVSVHKEMFGDVWEWAGNVRTRDLTLGIGWSLIGERLGGLCLDIEAWPDRDELVLEQAVEIHHRSVYIHPFENGNGRWSRLLANIWLMRQGKSPIEWPEAEVGEAASDIRQTYIDAIRAADEHDMGPLMGLHEKFWSES